MKIPVSPPDCSAVMEASYEQDRALTWRILSEFSMLDNKGRYLHWDKLRHLPVPEGFTSEQWWAGIKSARQKSYQALPLLDKKQTPFLFCTPDSVQRQLQWLDWPKGVLSKDLAL